MAPAPVTVDYLRACARCRRLLVDEDELGWYYQTPVIDSRAPGLTFMDRVHECDGQPHMAVPVSRCKHPKCGKAIARCDTLSAHFGCSSARGWIHVGVGAHACEARFDGPDAEPEEEG
jgi:hypothetical protein